MKKGEGRQRRKTEKNKEGERKEKREGIREKDKGGRRKKKNGILEIPSQEQKRVATALTTYCSPSSYVHIRADFSHDTLCNTSFTHLGTFPFC